MFILNSEMESMSAALQKAETRASQASKSTEALEYQLSEVRHYSGFSFVISIHYLGGKYCLKNACRWGHPSFFPSASELPRVHTVCRRYRPADLQSSQIAGESLTAVCAVQFINHKLKIGIICSILPARSPRKNYDNIYAVGDITQVAHCCI
jgi:hypothetical protein